MTDLLIHSMREFASIILPALEIAQARDIAEIGAEFGGMSQLLGDHCAAKGGHLTSIDPGPRAEFLEWVAHNPHVTHVPALSLEAIPTLGAVDAWFVDGDHNYYTVRNELALIDAACRRDHRPLLAFLHDVGWPCARRDQYYAPDTVPVEHRQPSSFDVGVTLGDAGFQVGRGFRGCGHWAVALQAGGARNGVLTAVEDFIAAASDDNRPLTYIHIPAVFGLGVVFDATAPWAPALHALLAPWHNHPLLAALEVNRLRNYLAVIEWQDRMADAAR